MAQSGHNRTGWIMSWEFNHFERRGWMENSHVTWKVFICNIHFRKSMKVVYLYKGSASIDNHTVNEHALWNVHSWLFSTIKAIAPLAICFVTWAWLSHYCKVLRCISDWNDTPTHDVLTCGQLFWVLVMTLKYFMRYRSPKRWFCLD